MASRLQKLRLGEVVQLCDELLDRREILHHYPLTTAFVALFEQLRVDLLEATKPAEPTVPLGERQRLEIEVERLDGEFDHEVRALNALLEALAVGYPDRAELYRRCKRALFPTGARLVTTSLRNQAGQAPRLRALRDEKTVAEALATTIDGEPLDARLARLIAAAEGLVEPLSVLVPEEGPEQRRKRHYKIALVSRFVGLFGQLRSMAELAEWSEEELDQVFGALDRLLDDR
jgi:hypothetical protein